MELSVRRNELLNKFFFKIENETYPEPISELHTGITEKMLDQLTQKFCLPASAKILDIGCGQGPALDFLKKKNYNPVGIALNDEDVRVCRAKGFEVYKMDQSFLEFENDSFDFIWARHCIEHSIAPYLTLSEFYRVSKPDSYLYIEVPAPDTVAHHENNPNHYSVLSKSMWTSLISRSGFTVMDVATFNIQLVIGPDEYWGFICKSNKPQYEKVEREEKSTNRFESETVIKDFDYHFEKVKKFLEENKIAPASEEIINSIEKYHASPDKKNDIRFAELLDIAGNLALANNNLDLAHKYFEEELKLETTSSSACTGLGKVFFAEENYKNAKVMFEWGVKNDPYNRDALESLSKINELLGLEKNHSSLVG